MDMADDQKPRSIAEHKRSLEADAVLNQMFEYSAPEISPRRVVSELDARKAA
jgi:hypothetical protein